MVCEDNENVGFNASSSTNATTPPMRASNKRIAIAPTTRRRERDLRWAARFGGQTGLGAVSGGAAKGSVLSILSTGGANSMVRSTGAGALVPSAPANAVTNASQLPQRERGSLASPRMMTASTVSLSSGLRALGLAG